jgi:hypothetical protein
MITWRIYKILEEEEEEEEEAAAAAVLSVLNNMIHNIFKCTGSFLISAAHIGAHKILKFGTVYVSWITAIGRKISK